MGNGSCMPARGTSATATLGVRDPTHQSPDECQGISFRPNDHSWEDESEKVRVRLHDKVKEATSRHCIVFSSAITTFEETRVRPTTYA
jgi:hypothetical protein